MLPRGATTFDDEAGEGTMKQSTEEKIAHLAGLGLALLNRAEKPARSPEEARRKAAASRLVRLLAGVCLNFLAPRLKGGAPQ